MAQSPGMSQVPPVTDSAVGKASTGAGMGAGDLTSTSEKGASSVSPPALTHTPAPKLRSCVVCRSRKVRCDKLSPCSNCRRANIACVFPSTDRPPRWARRLERMNNNEASSARTTQETGPGVGQVMERLHNLESLVKELSGQLEQANAAPNSTRGGSSSVNSPGSSVTDRDAHHQVDTSSTTVESTTNSTGVQKQFGRMVLQDTNRSRYVSSGFWSRVNDEVCGTAKRGQASLSVWLGRRLT